MKPQTDKIGNSKEIVKEDILNDNEPKIVNSGKVVHSPLHERALNLYGKNDSMRNLILSFNNRYPDKKFKSTWKSLLVFLRLLMEKGPIHLRTKVFEGRPVDKMCIAILAAMIVSEDFVERDLRDMQMIIARNTERGVVPWEILTPYTAFAIDAYYRDIS